MQQTKRQGPIRAQVTFYYELYEEKLKVKSTEDASRLFLQFARSINLMDGWYVIFLDKKQNFRCWYNLENFLDIPVIAADIAGFAKLIKARYIFMARLNQDYNPKIEYLDICWITALLEKCGEKHIQLIDYLVVTEENWCSYQQGTFIE